MCTVDEHPGVWQVPPERPVRVTGGRTDCVVDALFARLAHAMPQYGCTVAPSTRLGFLLQCLGAKNIQQFPNDVRDAHAHTTYSRSGI